MSSYETNRAKSLGNVKGELNQGFGYVLTCHMSVYTWDSIREHIMSKGSLLNNPCPIKVIIFL